MKSVAIILNTPDDIAEITETDVICADGGVRHLKSRRPIAVVGDFDSTVGIISSDVPLISFPAEKNETDGQLALDYAKAQGYGKAVIYGALGGRIEHILGNIGLLEYARKIGLNAFIKEPTLKITLFDASFTVQADAGDTLSVFSFGGGVTVKHSRGLYYPLENLYLPSGTNRGISNIAVKEEIGLDFDDGRLLVIHYKKT